MYQGALTHCVALRYLDINTRWCPMCSWSERGREKEIMRRANERERKKEITRTSEWERKQTNKQANESVNTRRIFIRSTHKIPLRRYNVKYNTVEKASNYLARGRHGASTHSRNLIHYRINVVESFPVIIILHIELHSRADREISEFSK